MNASELKSCPTVYDLARCPGRCAGGVTRGVPLDVGGDVGLGPTLCVRHRTSGRDLPRSLLLVARFGNVAQLVLDILDGLVTSYVWMWMDGKGASHLHETATAVWNNSYVRWSQTGISMHMLQAVNES